MHVGLRWGCLCLHLCANFVMQISRRERKYWCFTTTAFLWLKCSVKVGKYTVIPSFPLPQLKKKPSCCIYKRGGRKYFWKNLISTTHTMEAVLQTLMWGSRRINQCANRTSSFMLRVLTCIWEVECNIRDLFSAFIFSPTTHCCLQDFKRRRKKSYKSSGPLLFFLQLFCSHCKFISPCLTVFTTLILLHPHRPQLSTGLQSHYYTVTTVNRVHHCSPQNSGSTDVSVTSQTTTTYPVHHHHHRNNNITNW